MLDRPESLRRKGGGSFSTYRIPVVVLGLCLVGLTVVSHIHPQSVTVTHSLLLNISITTAALVIALGAAYFALMEFFLYGRTGSLLLGLGFLLLAESNFGTGLVPVLAGWKDRLLVAETGWALQRSIAAALLVGAALIYSRRSVQSSRLRLLVGGVTIVTALAAAALAWVVLTGGSGPLLSVNRVLQLLAGDVFFGAALLFWRAARVADGRWFVWLAVNFIVAGFAQLQYAAGSYAPNIVNAGDVLRLVFVAGIFLGLVVEWSRGYRRLRVQTKELEVLHALMAAPSLQETADVIHHIARVVGDALRSATQVVRAGREAADGEERPDASLGDGQRGIVVFNEEPRGQAGLAAPLEVRGHRLGTLIVARRADDPFTADDIRLLRACAIQASVLLDRSLLYEEVAAGAVLEERSRLAREIHDGLAQHLAFLKMRVAWLKRSPATVDARQLQDIEGVLGTALAEARQAISTLRSEPNTTTAVDAIRSYAEDFGRISGLLVHVNAQDGAPDVGPRVRVELLRIVQEALNNVRKHAAASRVDVLLRGCEDGLEVSVHDDGQGFRSEGAPAGHFGLDIMRERAESIGGTLSVSSTPSAGTQVVVRVPARGEGGGWPQLAG